MTGRASTAAALILLACGIVLSTLAPSQAHRRDDPAAGETRGVLIPPVAHGEMGPLADRRSAVLALAERQPRTDEAFRRVLNFAKIQFAYCLWGLAPGAISDESSPFNECAHAYLSATKALLARMGETAREGDEVRALAAAIGRDVAAREPVLCRFSEEPFDTARTIYPDWSAAIGHPPTLLAFSAMGAMLAGAALPLFARTRRPERRSRPAPPPARGS
jgi:hypothetical protein